MTLDTTQTLHYLTYCLSDAVVLWGKTPCSVVSVFPCFGGTYGLHLKNRSHFFPEDGGSIFFWNEVIPSLKMETVGYAVETKSLSPWRWTQYFSTKRSDLYRSDGEMMFPKDESHVAWRWRQDSLPKRSHFYAENGGSISLGNEITSPWRCGQYVPLNRIHLYPEDGGSMLLQNIGTHLPDYTTAYRWTP
jgi:hypothetical protein